MIPIATATALSIYNYFPLRKQFYRDNLTLLADKPALLCDEWMSSMENSFMIMNINHFFISLHIDNHISSYQYKYRLSRLTRQLIFLSNTITYTLT